MKDPLHIEQTPYEVLGVDITAGKEEIEAAAEQAFVNRVPPGKVVNNRTRLLNLEKRALVDIFHYHGPFLRQLVPPVSKDQSKLLVKRKEVADAWENINRKNFPHSPSVHSLAVLWYHWTQYEEEKRRAVAEGKPFPEQKGLTEAPTLEELWSNTIAYWTMIINSADFWEAWRDSRPGAEVSALRQRLESHFSNLLQSFAERDRKAHGENAPPGNWGRLANSSLSPYRELECSWGSEMITARNMRRANITISVGGEKVQLCSGRLILEKVDLLAEARREINLRLSGDRDDKLLKQVSNGLSDSWKMAHLLMLNNYDAVIEEYRALPAAGKRSDEALALAAEAYREKGKQLFEGDEFKAAFERWAQGFETGRQLEETAAVITEKTGLKVSALRNSEPEAAVNLLEQALELVKQYDPDQERRRNLEQHLGQTLNIIAVRMTNDILEQLKKEQVDRGKVIAVLKQSLPYLERAVALGYRDAKKNLGETRKLIEQLEVISPQEKVILERIKTLVEAGKLDEAIALLETLGGEAARALLPELLNQRAVKNANIALKNLENLKKERDQNLHNDMNQVMEGHAERRQSVIVWFLIVVTAYTIFFQPYKYLSIPLLVILLISRLVSYYHNNLENVLYMGRGQCGAKYCRNAAEYRYMEKPICKRHKNKLEEIIKKHSAYQKSVPADITKLLLSAKRDLEKASGIDPKNQKVKESLEQVGKFISAAS